MLFFFFHAEDGILDTSVTGVQTCALPICNHELASGQLAVRVARRLGLDGTATHTLRQVIEHHLLMASVSQRRDLDDRSEERRVGKEWRWWGAGGLCAAREKTRCTRVVREE